MATKHFCDLCGQEVSKTIKMSKLTFEKAQQDYHEVDPFGRIYEICIFCAAKVEQFITKAQTKEI